jgi:hypothetical protein
MISVQISDSQQFTLRVAPQTARNKPAPVDGPPTWECSDESVAKIQPADDGLSCKVVGMAPGSCIVRVSADADLGEGVVTISDSANITITSSTADHLALSSGEVEPQPE